MPTTQWKLRDPWKAHYQQHEVLKIVFHRLKNDLFHNRKTNFLQRELLLSAALQLIELHKIEEEAVSKGKLPNDYRAKQRHYFLVLSKLVPSSKKKTGSPAKGATVTSLEDIINDK